MDATDIPRRLTRPRTPITLPHVRWREDAPSIVTRDYYRCKPSEVPWPGEQDLSGGKTRIVPMPHLDAMIAESARVGWPKDYRRDLFVFDRRTLAFVPANVPLVWMLRECGSCLYIATPDMIDSKHHAWDAPLFVERCFGEGKVRFYTWDGTRLREHRTAQTASEATRELAKAYGESFGPCFLPPVSAYDYRKARHVAVQCGG